jgi:hypothetical protein
MGVDSHRVGSSNSDDNSPEPDADSYLAGSLKSVGTRCMGADYYHAEDSNRADSQNSVELADSRLADNVSIDYRSLSLHTDFGFGNAWDSHIGDAMDSGPGYGGHVANYNFCCTGYFATAVCGIPAETVSASELVSGCQGCWRLALRPRALAYVP